MWAHTACSNRPRRGRGRAWSLAVGCLAVWLFFVGLTGDAAASDRVAISGEVRMLVAEPADVSGEITIGYRFAGAITENGPDRSSVVVSLEEAWVQGFVFPQLADIDSDREGFVEDTGFVEVFYCPLVVDDDLELQVNTGVVLTLPTLRCGDGSCLAAYYDPYVASFGGMVLDLGPMGSEFAESLYSGAVQSSQQAVFAEADAVITVVLTAGGGLQVPVVGGQYRVEDRRVVLRAHPHPASRPTAEMEYGDEYTVLGVWADADGVYWVETADGWIRRGSPQAPWL